MARRANEAIVKEQTRKKPEKNGELVSVLCVRTKTKLYRIYFKSNIYIKANVPPTLRDFRNSRDRARRNEQTLRQMQLLCNNSLRVNVAVD
jgi:hypothetical protein